MEKINKFLKYYSIILLINFLLSMVVVSLIVSFDKPSFCYEVVPEGEGLVLDGVFYYSNESSCNVVTVDEFNSLKDDYFWPKVFSFVGLLGWLAFSPDFRDRLKEKLKSSKQ